MIRILRAERAPRCADTLVLPLVGSHAARQEEVPTHVRATLVGLGLAARLRRTVVDPPKSPNVESRGELEAYFAEQLFPWATEQSKAIFQMAREGSLLSGYARGVVAIEAGMADMRFVEMAREVPIPREMREDPEVAEIYYATLDEALEPRKNRGRDAALVGLAELSRVGIASSQRLDAARALIARVFAGNRMMALDSLVLPELPPCSESSDEEQIATRVESAHVAAVLSKKTPSRELSACLLHRGLPLFLERSLTSSTLASDHALLGRGHFELGRTYFDAERFQKAEAALSRALDAEEGGPSLDGWAQASFFRSLAVALAAGPRDPVDLFRYGSRLPRPLGDLTLLDAVASATTELSPLAMFDGALLRELAPEEGSPAFWQDLAKRYEVAGQGLEGTDRKEARARALAAKQTATELRKRLN
jgi:tetratricopeptide (TPR) repeat protein